MINKSRTISNLIFKCCCSCILKESNVWDLFISFTYGTARVPYKLAKKCLSNAQKHYFDISIA